MKKIMTILMALMLTLQLTSCKDNNNSSSIIEYNKNDAYKVINSFIMAVQDEDYNLAKSYYKDGENIETISFNSIVTSSSFGKAIINEGKVSYNIQKYDEATNTVRVSFVYEDASHYITIDNSNGDYKLVFNEEEK